jgi:hypothetical protein
MLNNKKVPGNANANDVHEVGMKCIYQSHTLIYYIHIYICLFILTFMALLLSDRSTEDRLGRKVASVASREMPKNTKADDHSFEVRHPRCVLNKSNCKVYAYIVKQLYIRLYAIYYMSSTTACFGDKFWPSSGCKMKTYQSVTHACVGCREWEV